MTHKTVEIKVSTYSFDELNGAKQQLINLAKEQVIKAYAPYSNFCVGAAVELENGAVFAGSNQENSAYPSGLCAERVALFYANAQFPEVPVKMMAICAFQQGQFLEEPATPCGSCRQVLVEAEMRFKKNIIVLLYGTKKVYEVENIRQLLPLHFEILPFF